MGYLDEVPDQELNPPEPRRIPTWEEYLEHEQDRLIDEEREKQYEDMEQDN